MKRQAAASESAKVETEKVFDMVDPGLHVKADSTYDCT